MIINPKFLVEKDIFEENLVELIDAIHFCGYQYKVDNYVPFEGTKIKELFNEHDCVVAHCSLQMASYIQRNCSWIPGVFYNRKNYECTSYYNMFGNYLLNSRYIMLPYGELIRQKDFLIETLGNNNCLFVRPNSGHKIFTGTVIDCNDYADSVKKLGFYDVYDNDLVVVAEPKNILREWRFVISKNRIVASSLYKEHGKHIQEEGSPKEVYDYVSVVAKTNWRPDLIWTLDICETNEGLFVIEIGSASCSGLYKCNKKEVVKAMAEAAAEEWININQIQY